jgi:predicted nucleic acid-binding protein
MTDKIFIDSNVLVYAYDQNAPMKGNQARLILDRLVAVDRGVISTQVITEYFNVVTRKLKPGLPIPLALERIRHYLDIFPVLGMSAEIVREACRGVEEHRLAFLDAEIWSTARQYGIPTIFSEDFSDGAEIEGVTFINPFGDAFNAGKWRLS